MKTAILLTLAVLLPACTLPLEPYDSTPVFTDFYNSLPVKHVNASGAESAERTLTISVREMPLYLFARYLADQAGVSVIVGSDLDELPVTLEAVDVNLSDLMSVVARRLGVEVVQRGDLYYLGALRAEDIGILVRRVGGYSLEDLDAAVSVLLSEFGRVASLEDGVLIIGDRVEVLVRVNEMLDAMESAKVKTWLVQVYLISVRNADSQAFGFDVIPAIELSARLASAGDVFEASAGLDAVLTAAQNSERLSVVSSPLMLMLDGVQASWRRVTTIPIAQPIVLDSGAVATAGFEDQEVGLTVRSRIRGQLHGRGRFELSIENTSLLDVTAEGAAITDGFNYDTVATVRDGGVYLLGSLGIDQRSDNLDGQTGLVRSMSSEATQLHVWAKVYAVDGPAKSASIVNESGRLTASIRDQFAHHDPERLHVALELAERDGQPNDVEYIAFLLGSNVRNSD